MEIEITFGQLDGPYDLLIETLDLGDYLVRFRLFEDGGYFIGNHDEENWHKFDGIYPGLLYNLQLAANDLTKLLADKE